MRLVCTNLDLTFDKEWLNCYDANIFSRSEKTMATEIVSATTTREKNIFIYNFISYEASCKSTLFSIINFSFSTIILVSCWRISFEIMQQHTVLVLVGGKMIWRNMLLSKIYKNRFKNE